MPRPNLPKKLRRRVPVLVKLHDGERRLLDAVRRKTKIKSRAALLRESFVAAAEGRAPAWRERWRKGTSA